MKIRTGFVSNSSSSSFVIKSDIVYDQQFNTLKILKEFLLVQKQELLEWQENTEQVEKTKKAYNDVFRWIEDNKETHKNPQLMFPSCNYDTYIWKLSNGNIKINTCNNTNWNDALDILNAEYCSDGEDEGDWPEMPMAKQPAEWDSNYLFNCPDKSKIIVLKSDTKYSDLPILYQPKEKKSRFVALLEE